MKPLQCHYRDPDSKFYRVLSLFIRLNADRPSGYRHMAHHPVTPDNASGDETEGTTEYYQLTRSDVANSDVGKTPSEDEEVEL